MTAKKEKKIFSTASLSQEEIMRRAAEKKKKYRARISVPTWNYKKQYGILSDYGVAKKLREVGKSNNEFEIMISNLTFEELIALKLEISSKLSNRIFSFRIIKSLQHIVREAVIRYAVAMCSDKHEACRWLGVNVVHYMKFFQKRYRAESWFYPRNKNPDDQPDSYKVWDEEDSKFFKKEKDKFMDFLSEMEEEKDNFVGPPEPPKRNEQKK